MENNPTRIAINGLGRIGSLVLRHLQPSVEKGEIVIEAVNGLGLTPFAAYYGIKYDTVHGRFSGEIRYDDDHVIVNGNKIAVLAVEGTESLPWRDLNVDVVLESSGVFKSAHGEGGGYMGHLRSGARRLVLSTPPEDDVAKTVVLGVNYDPRILDDYSAISNASCTTNCLAPIVKVLDDTWGVEYFSAITVHAWTKDQNLGDGRTYSDPRRGRAASENIVPTTTGAAEGTVKIFPHIKGETHAFAYRVPVADGSLLHLEAKLSSDVSAEAVNLALEEASNSNLEGILEVTHDPIVSSDAVGDPHSAIVDGLLTERLGDGRIKIVGWYDNEWAYALRIKELIDHIAHHLQSGS